MFGRKRKPESEALIYADARPAEAKAGGKKRLPSVVLLIAAVALAVMAVTTVHLRVQDMRDRYDQALLLLEQREYEAALTAFGALGDFRDSRDRAARLEQQRADYDAAAELVDQQRYEEAIAAFRSLGDYADSPQWAAYGVTYRMALDLLTELDVGKTRLLTRLLPEQVRLTDENSYPAIVGYEAAAALLESLGDYRSAPALVDRCYYSAGLVKLGWKDWEGALAYLEKMTPATAEAFFREYEQRYTEETKKEG